MNVELTLSRSASFVSSIIDPSAFFVHFFNSFLLILKILVRDDLRRSQIRYSKGHMGLSWTYKFVTVSTEGKRIFEIIIGQSQTEQMNFTVDLWTGFGLCTWESYLGLWHWSYDLFQPYLPGGKFNSFMKILHFSMWLVCISIDTSIEIFVERSFEFFLFATQKICLTSFTPSQSGPWKPGPSGVRV